MNRRGVAILDRPAPPSKPPTGKKVGGEGRYFIKARCEVLRRSKAGRVVGEAWGFSQYISVMERVETVARAEAAKRYADGDFDISPPVCSFFPEQACDQPLDEIFYAFKDS